MSVTILADSPVRVCAVLNTCALLRGVDSETAFLEPWRLPSANREVHDRWRMNRERISGMPFPPVQHRRRFMRARQTVFAFAFAGGTLALPAMAQPPPIMAVVITIAAPVFSSADDGQTPIGVATIGSTLRVIETTEGWYRVNFDDRETGLRVRFIRMKDARLVLTNSSRLRQYASGTTDTLPDVQSWSGQFFE